MDKTVTIFAGIILFSIMIIMSLVVFSDIRSTQINKGVIYNMTDVGIDIVDDVFANDALIMVMIILFIGLILFFVIGLIIKASKGGGKGMR